MNEHETDTSIDTVLTPYLTFEIAGDAYGVGILKVREILQYEALTRVPGTPTSIRGVMNLRGSVIPVVDLAVRFGVGETRVSSRTCVVIVEIDLDGQRTVMGVMADGVREVLELHESDIQVPPSFGTQVRVDYLVGMARYGHGFLLVLDIDRVLAAEGLEAVALVRAALGEAAEEAAADRAERKPRARRKKSAEHTKAEGGEAPGPEAGEPPRPEV